MCAVTIVGLTKESDGKLDSNVISIDKNGIILKTALKEFKVKVSMVLLDKDATSRLCK